MKFNLFFLSAALSAFALVAGAPAASENAHVSVTTASEADITAYLSGVTELEAPKEVALEKRQSLSLVYYCQNAPWVQPCYTVRIHRLNGGIMPYKDTYSASLKPG